MLDKFTYINHLGKAIHFGTGGLYVNYSDLRDYTWSYDTTNDKISNFRKGVVTKQLPFVIKSVDGDAIRNRIYEVADEDVRAGIKGTLFFGELIDEEVAMFNAKRLIGKSFMKCYIYSISTSNYLISKGYKTGTIGICTDTPSWNNQEKFSFAGQTDTATTGFEYPYDYPIGYNPPEHGTGYINNTAAFASDFEMVVWGSTNKVEIYINNHKYGVDIEIGANDYLIINSSKKTIVLYKNGETTVNAFSKRYKEESVFEKIPSGQSTVTWNGTYGFDIYTVSNRSEPKWGD